MLWLIWWLIPGPEQFLHVLLAVLVVASAVRFPYARISGIAFHVLAGVALLLCPSLIHSATISGKFDVLHSFLQRFGAAFHFGFAYFNYRTLHDRLRIEPAIYLAKAITALALLFNEVFTAYHLLETKERGLQISDKFLSSAILLEGVWLGVELYRLFLSYQQRDAAGELNLLSKRTQRYLTNDKAVFDVEIALIIDATLSLAYALVNFAFPRQILTFVIKREYPIDGLHVLFSRQFGAFFLFSAIVSLLATQFTYARQKNYIFQRILTQSLIFFIHIIGHWGYGVYSTSHITPFMISGFYITVLLSIYYRIKAQLPEGVEDEDDIGASTSIRTTTYKKTVKTT